MAETEKKVVDETTQSPVTRDQEWRLSTGFTPLEWQGSWKAWEITIREQNTLDNIMDFWEEEVTQEVPEIITPEVTTPEVTTPEIDTTETEIKPDIPKPTTPEVDTKTETVKEEVPEKSQEQLFAEQNNIDFIKWDDGSFLFDPKTGEEAIDIGIQFGTDKINKFSLQNKSAQAVIAKYGKYKNAPKEVYTQGFKDNEIGVGGETWERLVKMNWGQPTAEMIQAQEEYDKDLKINNVNNTTNIIAWKDLKTVNPVSDIEKLDISYEKTISNLFWDLATNWKTYKSGNDTLSNLNASMTATSASIDELNVEKRKVLDNVKKQYPNLSLGQQLNLAQQDTDAIDDQLFVLQRQYNSDLSTYKFEDTKAQWEFEYTAGLINKKMELAENIYGTQRGDLITKESIDRQDKLLSESITRSQQAKKEAIAQWDIEAAQTHAYNIALAEAKAKINKENQVRFTTANLWDGAVLKYDKFTWEETIVTNEAADIPESTITGSWKITQFDFITPGWNKKPLNVDETASPSLQNAIKTIQMEVPGGDSIIVWDTFRTTEEQKHLHDKFVAWTGWLAAKPGTSKHEIGMSIDIYADDKFNPLTTEQIQVMNKNGWYQTAWKNDLGHFEYLWNQEQSFDLYDSLSWIDRLKTDSYLSWLLRSSFDASKDAKVPEDIKDAANILLEKVEETRVNHPELTDLFRILSKWGSKLSDQEWALIWADEIRFAKDWNKDAFVKSVRNLVQKKLKDNDIDIDSRTNSIEKYDRLQGLLEWMDSNKWKAAQKAINDWIWLSSWEEFDKFATLNGFNTAMFVKEISGAAVTDEEFKRLSGLLPSVWDTIELAQNKLAEFRLQEFNWTMNPAVSVMFNSKADLYTVYPELEWGWVYNPNKETKTSSLRNRWRSPEVTNTAPSNNLKFNINK